MSVEIVVNAMPQCLVTQDEFLGIMDSYFEVALETYLNKKLNISVKEFEEIIKQTAPEKFI